MEENRELDIDLRKVFEMLKKKAIFIVLIAVIGAILAACFTNFFIPEQYTATVKLYAYSSNDNRLTTDSTISLGQYDVSAKLVKTYLEVVKSHTFLEKVADKFDNKISAGQIRGMMSCAQIEDTLAFQISITSTNPELAQNVANTIAQTCPDEIVRVLKVGGVETIDEAVKPSSPSSPNMKKNVMIGFIAAFAVSFVFFFIKELFDTSIKDEKDLQREFDIPILGSIPRLVPVAEKAKTEDSDNNLEPPKPALDLTLTEKEEK